MQRSWGQMPAAPWPPPAALRAPHLLPGLRLLQHHLMLMHQLLLPSRLQQQAWRGSRAQGLGLMQPQQGKSLSFKEG